MHTAAVWKPSVWCVCVCVEKREREKDMISLHVCLIVLKLCFYPVIQVNNQKRCQTKTQPRKNAASFGV